MSGDRAPRLWVVTECYPRPAAPSACAFAHRQMAGVRKAGFDVRVLVPNGWFPPLLWRAAPAWRSSRRSAIPGRWQVDGIPVSDLRVQNRVPSRLSRPRDYVARVSLALSKRLNREGAQEGDLLMAQFALPYGTPVRESALALGLRYVVQLRGDDVWVWPHWSDAAMQSFVTTLRDASLVTAVSQSLIDEARRLCGGTLPPAAVIPNGIDLRRFRPVQAESARAAARLELGVPRGAMVLVCVGDLLERKGWLDLLDALGAWKSRPAELVLLGVAGTRVEELDLLAESARRAPGLQVVLHQGLGADEVAGAYRTADVFALASHWEGMANALLEAMASGLPVITTAVAGHPEAITPGQEGWLVPPRDRAALLEALGAAFDSESQRRRMGEAARRRAESIGDSRQAGDRLARLLDAARDPTCGTSRLRDLIGDVSPYAEAEARAGVAS